MMDLIMVDTNTMNELKRLAEIAKIAQDKAYELNKRFWDADEGKVPCSDEEYAQIERDYDEAEREEKSTHQDCLKYVEKIANEMSFMAYKLDLPAEVWDKVEDAVRKSLEEWLDNYGLNA